MQRQWTVEHEGRTFTWVRGRWTCRGQVVPQAQWLPLQRRLVDEVKARGLDTLPVAELREVADLFMESGSWALAVEVLERVMAQAPEDLAVAVGLARAYRRTSQPERALALTERFLLQPTAALLNVRAAALCDLERLGEARKMALKAQALGGGAETAALLERIRDEQAGED